MSGVRSRRVVIAALGAFAGLFVLVRTNRSAAFDLAVTLKVQQIRSARFAWLMRAVSWPGFPPQSRLIPPTIIAALMAGRRRRDAALQTAAWGGALVSTVIKGIVRRDRPLPPAVEVVVAPLGGTSFPSGHVLTYVAFYGFLAHLVADRGPDNLARGAAVGGLTTLLLLVGPSRIVQGHHWATDVAASYVLGIAYVAVLIELDRRTAPPARVRRW
jgi:membrane-associated phospholipid phosphatase